MICRSLSQPFPCTNHRITPPMSIAGKGCARDPVSEHWRAMFLPAVGRAGANRTQCFHEQDRPLHDVVHLVSNSRPTHQSQNTLPAFPRFQPDDCASHVRGRETLDEEDGFGALDGYVLWQLLVGLELIGHSASTSGIASSTASLSWTSSFALPVVCRILPQALANFTLALSWFFVEKGGRENRVLEAPEGYSTSKCWRYYR